MSTMIRYNEDDIMTKNFTFKIEMELSTLKKFKDVIFKHNMLNLKEVRFKARKHVRKVVEGNFCKQ